MEMLCSLPLPLSLAVTLRMPLASMSKVTSICGTPRGAGDLYLKIELKDHPFYRLEGFDVYCDLPISPSEAVLGAQVEVPTLDGVVKLRIPPGMQPGRKLRLAERGFPKGNGERGDFYVVVQIHLPTQISEEERELYERLQRVQSYDPRATLKL